LQLYLKQTVDRVQLECQSGSGDGVVVVVVSDIGGGGSG
jgi:hypothetical protein